MVLSLSQHLRPFLKICHLGVLFMGLLSGFSINVRHQANSTITVTLFALLIGHSMPFSSDTSTVAVNNYRLCKNPG